MTNAFNIDFTGLLAVGVRLGRRKVDCLERRKGDRLEHRKVTRADTEEIHSARAT